MASDAARFQAELDRLGQELGEYTQKQFDEAYLKEWPDEESTTGGLLGALRTAADLLSRRAGRTTSGLALRATLTKKHDEAAHGVDALISFRCDEPEWRIETTVLLQAKRQEPGRPLPQADLHRLSRQIASMVSATTECFVVIYSKEEGIRVVPAVALLGLQSRDLFDVSHIAWPRFLSGILRARLGEVVQSRVPMRSDGEPMYRLELRAERTKSAAPPLAAAAAH